MEKRHFERIKNPLPHQVFQSVEHVIANYKNCDINPFDDKYIYDVKSYDINSYDLDLNLIKRIKNIAAKSGLLRR